MSDIAESHSHTQEIQDEFSLDLGPDPEYVQTGVVTFEGMAAYALANYMYALSDAIRNGGTDQDGNDRLVAVVPARSKFPLAMAYAAGFRTAEIDNKNQLVGLELIPEGHRTRPVRVDTNPEIIENT